MLVAAAGLIFISAMPGQAAGQSGVLPLSGRAKSSASNEDPNDHNWKRFAFGFGASVLAHEGAHVLSSVLMGYHPYYAFDHGRPTVYSGINSEAEPHKQFIFSASGLTTQAIINEAILDIPHSGGGPIERGILAGGIGTTLFYITLGRNASVSDISYMARTSSLSKTQISLIFGGVSAIQALRISRDPRYDHFFMRATPDGFGFGMSY
jgi:hypothetical protein